MNSKDYLARIGLIATPITTKESLFEIHQKHVFHVPFENLDVQLRRKISLSHTDLYHKIVTLKRGGFCYELNHLFHWLLNEIGFQNLIISCRIFNSEGIEGPEFDHMAIVAILNDKKWLLDVGFGDLFVTPIEITPGEIQCDGRNYFRIKERQKDYCLQMSSDGIVFEDKYTFLLKEHKIEDFKSACRDKESGANSYFVKNLICTKPLPSGRITIFNNRLIRRENEEKKELPISTKTQLHELLARDFGILS